MAEPSLDTRAVACANCGAPVTGAFCPACGQSREELNRPIAELVGGALGDLFAFDGRFARTLSRLYTRPGSVGRAYMDGQRQSYTPPTRLYVLMSLLFFVALAAMGLRILTVHVEPIPEELRAVVTQADDALPVEVRIAAFASPQPELDPQVRARLEDELANPRSAAALENNPILRLVVAVMREPERVEAFAATVTTAATIAMVVVLALINAIVHPRTRLIAHLVNALYVHAAVFPLLLVAVGGSHLGFGGGDGDTPVTPVVAVGMASLAVVTVALVFWDRGFYRSSWLGAVLRAPFVVFTYILAFGGLIMAVAAIALSVPAGS